MPDFLPPPPPPQSDPPFMGGFSGEPTLIPARLGRRFWASVLDGILVVVTLGIGWLIWSVVLFQQGTSPGKKMLGLAIVDSKSGEIATFGQMALREVIGKVVLSSVSGGLTTAIGTIMIRVTPTRVGLWDLVARTMVVHRG